MYFNTLGVRISIYEPSSTYEASVDIDRCRFQVPMGGRSVGHRQCGNRGKYPWEHEGTTYGFCGVHHPDALVKKEKALQARWAKEREESSEKFRRQTAVHNFCRDVDTDLIELLPPLSEIIDEHHDGISLRELAELSKDTDRFEVPSA